MRVTATASSRVAGSSSSRRSHEPRAPRSPGQHVGIELDLQRADAGRQLEHARHAARRATAAARACTRIRSAEVEHHLAVLDEQVVVAAASPGDRGSTAPASRRPRTPSSPLAGAARADGTGRPAQRRRAPPRRPTTKRTVSPGRSWPSFQRSALTHGRRADEPAERRAVGTEDDRHVAREVDRADAVRGVVDVGGCRPASPPVLARPPRPRPDQAHAGPRRVEVHLPGGGVEHLTCPRG